MKGMYQIIFIITVLQTFGSIFYYYEENFLAAGIWAFGLLITSMVVGFLDIDLNNQKRKK